MCDKPADDPHSPHGDARLSRRQLLQNMAAGAVAATVASAFTGGATSSASGASQSSTAPSTPIAEGRIRHAASTAVQPFDLADVRLTDGPFLDAQRRDEKYLLSLEPDRLLHNFRTNAGLQPKAPVYGGWESVATWADIRCHGHTLGHYLTACSLMFAATANPEFKRRVDYIIADLSECQTAGKTGLICAFPDNATQFEHAQAGQRIVGVPWYTTHKVMAGLRDACLYCQNPQALQVLTALADWALALTRDMSDQLFQRMLNTEHGGMNEALADTYVLSGDPKYLQFAQRFCHHALLDPFAQQRDTLDRLHANTQIPKFVGFNRLYILTAQPEYLAASRFFWTSVVTNRSFVTGSHGDQEHFFPVNTFEQHLTSAKTAETCGSYNMLRLTRMLFTLDASPACADYYECTLYNCILASQDPVSGMMTYFQPLRPGYFKPYCTPLDSFWCCTGTGIENHAKYGDSIYFHNADALFVNLFIPSTLTWKDKGLTLTQTTKFPDEPSTTLQLALSSPTSLTINIRHPAWCQTVTIQINGKPHTTSQTPGSYIALNRQWRHGDTISIALPMTLRVQPLPHSTDAVALVYGPIVLAGALGNQGLATPGADLIVNERTIGTQLNDPIEVPTLLGKPQDLIPQIKPAAAPLTFTAPASNHPAGQTLTPYFRIAHERHTIYWKCSEPA